MDRGAPMEEEELSRPRSRLGEAVDKEGDVSLEVKESAVTEVEAALEGSHKSSKFPNEALSTQPLVSQAETNFLKMMDKMTQFMGQLTQSVSPRGNSRAPAYNTPSIKVPDSFDGTQAHKLRVFIQSCQLIFYNDPESLFSDRNKVLYSTSFLTGRAEKCIEPYLRNVSHEHPSYLLNTWELSLISRIGDWRERAYIDVYRRGLESRLLYQLATNPGTADSLQELMEINLKLDTKYHERQKETGGNQAKKPPVTGSNSSRPLNDSSSKKLHHKKNKKGKNSQGSKDKPHAAILNKDSKLIGSEKERMIKERLFNYCGGKKKIENSFKSPQNRPGSSKGFP
ncbi:hypothetical protein O181_011112 [Austropuccinia psidii MF-1]|uniref:Retrotransposon gag domain-containing protein n=1 Tax=Austropuccinia psidii MF-1 TaxID=1389203 RepID=A0A9Q3BTW9_9BASI|nr:hypothetical protein [Austropuccinia psidii MF-1]